MSSKQSDDSKPKRSRNAESEETKSDGSAKVVSGKQRKESKSKGSNHYRFGLALGFLVLRELRLASHNSDALVAELRVLFTGFATTCFSFGSIDTSVLSSAAPDIDRDRGVFAILVVSFFLANWGARIVIIEPFARVTLRLSGAKLAKFAQSVMEMLMYGMFTYIGLMIVPSQKWIWPSSNWWVGFADGGHEIMRSDFRCYYIMYVARYFQAIASVCMEAKRKDFVEMLLHHVVTVSVIYISYIYGWNRVGGVVMALLDPGDVPLHIAKLCKYTAEATGKHYWQFLADRFFEVFGVIFFVTRLIFFGYVCWSAHIEATRYFPKYLAEWTCVALLYTLLALQCYWFSLILKVAIRLWKGDGVDDIRSDSEDEAGAQKGNSGVASPVGQESKKQKKVQ